VGGAYEGMAVTAGEAHPAPRAVLELLRPERPTAIVDVGANPIDTDPPYKAMLAAGLCTVTGFEPQIDAYQELDRRKGPGERYLPYAIGDGRERMLTICHARGMTSTLQPDPAQLALFHELPLSGIIEATAKVPTRRLDDIREIEAMDFLKIDVQGGELEVFKGGRRLLAGAVVIQTEVSFITLYRNQPAFGVIDTQLRKLGFVPHCFAELKILPLAPLLVEGDPMKGVRQLLEGDAVYVRDFSRIENMSGEQWKHLALIAHHCYGSFDLALRAIIAAAARAALPSGAPERYLAMLRAMQIPVTMEKRGPP
jgi:FkbM family methyltransferase